MLVHGSRVVLTKKNWANQEKRRMGAQFHPTIEVRSHIR